MLHFTRLTYFEVKMSYCKKNEDWKCKMCGNALLVEDNDLSGGGTIYNDSNE